MLAPLLSAVSAAPVPTSLPQSLLPRSPPTAEQRQQYKKEYDEGPRSCGTTGASEHDYEELDWLHAIGHAANDIPKLNAAVDQEVPEEYQEAGLMFFLFVQLRHYLKLSVKAAMGFTLPQLALFKCAEISSAVCNICQSAVAKHAADHPGPSSSNIQM